MTATRFDLETTYLGLNGAGGVTELPVGPDFWTTVADNPAVGGTLVTVSAAEGDWPHWEMHPKGDEVLVLLEGALGIIFERPGGRAERHDLAPGATLIVPAGVWHRAVDQQGVRMLFITFGAGTTHRPVA